MVRDTVAIITALNEAETIAPLVGTLYDYGMDVLVIDDGSTDNTGELAKLHGALVLRHSRPYGNGRSLIEGYKMAMSQGNYRRFVQIDAGGSHDPAEVMRLLSHKADVVIGSRFCDGGHYIGNPKRQIASRIAAALCNFAKPKAHISDWTSGYRVYSRRAIGELIYLTYLANMHAWQIEMLLESLQRGLTIEEAPITYKAGRSSLRMSTIDEAIKIWLCLLFS